MPLDLLHNGIDFSLQRHGASSEYFRELRLQRDAVPALLTLDGKLQQAAPAAIETITRPARPLERYRHCRIPACSEPRVLHSTYYRRPLLAPLSSFVTVHDFIYEPFANGPRRWMHSVQKPAAIQCRSSDLQQPGPCMALCAWRFGKFARRESVVGFFRLLRRPGRTAEEVSGRRTG
jgi:hypothetical protein